jgi:hypothetical protein
LLSLVITAVCFCICVLFSRSIKKGSILSFFILVLFFSYGHVYSFLETKKILGIFVIGHKYLLPIFFLLGIGIIIFVKNLKNQSNFFKILNISTIFLFLFININIGVNAVMWQSSGPKKTVNPDTNSQTITNSKKHNIYFILLDGYSRKDLLLESGYDNNEFLNSLKQIGFIIPECGQSNYNDTSSSIASILNMEYVDKLGIDPNLLLYRIHSRTLTPYIRENLVRTKLAEYGYKIVASETPYDFLNISDADVYYKSPNLRSIQFQQLFMKTTILLAPFEWLEQYPEGKRKIPKFILMVFFPVEGGSNNQDNLFDNYLSYQQNIKDLENLKASSQIEGNLFVYSHLMVTHKPYVFTKTGEFDPNNQLNQSNYINQIQYVNSRMLEIVKSLLKNSQIPPIIILQSDHSTTKENFNTTKNFQAYYLPDFAQKNFDKYFTNVNIFRLIFNNYFGENLPILPNKSYFLHFKNPDLNQLQELSCP